MWSTSKVDPLSELKQADIEVCSVDVSLEKPGTSTPTSDNPTHDIQALDWDGPQDADNPHNWPTWKKILHTAIPALYSFALTVATSTWVAAVPSIEVIFNVSQTAAILPTSLYILGIAFGPMVFAPISELYGRRPVYWSNIPMLMIFNAIAAASNNFAVLCTFRFLAGFGGSGVLAVGAGTILDCWPTAIASRVSVFYVLAPFLGPTLGTLVGAYIVGYYDDWRFSIWVVLFICAPLAVLVLFTKETSHSRILHARAISRGSQIAKDSYSVEALGMAMLRPLHLCAIEPLALVISLYTAFNFAMMYSFFGSFCYVFTSVYGFNLKQVGLCYMGIVVGFFFAVATVGYFEATKVKKANAMSNGKIVPEIRLYPALLGTFLIPIGLFWFAWTPRHDIHWIVPVLAGLPFQWGCFSSFLSCITYLVDTYQANSASAIAANGFIRYILGAAFPLFIIQVYEALGVQWAGSIFAFISLALVPVPWIFFYYGKHLRARSRYGSCED